MGSYITTWNFAPNWKLWGIPSTPPATRKFYCMPTANGVKIVSHSSTACGGLLCGMDRKISCFAPEIGWEPNRSITGARETVSCLDQNWSSFVRMVPYNGGLTPLIWQLTWYIISVIITIRLWLKAWRPSDLAISLLCSWGPVITPSTPLPFLPIGRCMFIMITVKPRRSGCGWWQRSFPGLAAGVCVATPPWGRFCPEGWIPPAWLLRCVRRWKTPHGCKRLLPVILVTTPVTSGSLPILSTVPAAVQVTRSYRMPRTLKSVLRIWCGM